jgi:hypothetical protein
MLVGVVVAGMVVVVLIHRWCNRLLVSFVIL